MGDVITLAELLTPFALGASNPGAVGTGAGSGALVNGFGVLGTASGFISRAAGPEPVGPIGLVGRVSWAGIGGTSPGWTSSDKKIVRRGLGGWATTAPLYIRVPSFDRAIN